MGGYGGDGGGVGGAGGEGGADMMAEAEQEVQLTPTQLSLVGVIQSSASGEAAAVTCIQFHPHENLLLCVFGGGAMAIYDLSPIAGGISEAFATGSIRSGIGKDKDRKSKRLNSSH